MANQQDIATKCGVSVATVSRILKNDPKFNVSDETKRKVIQAANKLGYKKNIVQDINLLNLGLVQMHPESTILINPYYSKIEIKLEKKQFEHQVSLQKIRTTAERTFIYDGEQVLDGVLAIGIFSDSEIKELKKFSQNIVFLDYGPDDENYFSVMPNFELAVKLAINKFLDSGHEKIGFIGEKFSEDKRRSTELEYRWDYFEKIMSSKNMYNSNFCIQSDVSATGGYKALKDFFSENDEYPSAFFVSSDVIASGVIRAINEKGLKIPDDISLIAFNNTVLSEYALVPLTAISINALDMADTAFEYMRKLIKNHGNPQKTLVGCTLVERESVCQIKK